jgi:hypothetical protein
MWDVDHEEITLCVIPADDYEPAHVQILATGRDYSRTVGFANDVESALRDFPNAVVYCKTCKRYENPTA